ncbi:MAG: hypothetical protein ACK5V3_17225 [Bdellovibrionales bacterium]
MLRLLPSSQRKKVF